MAAPFFYHPTRICRNQTRKVKGNGTRIKSDFSGFTRISRTWNRS